MSPRDDQKALHGAATVTGAPTVDALTALPRLPALLDRISAHLNRNGASGILSLHIIRPEVFERRHGGPALDDLVVQTSRFLKAFAGRAMRHDDEALEVMVSGNAFVLLLGPAREKPQISLLDVGGARRRLEAALREFLEGRLPEGATLSPFACGCAILEADSDPERLERHIYSALDAALADALRRSHTGLDADITMLRRVLDERALATAYQPVIDLLTHEVIGFEALSRSLLDPKIGPDRLFRVAHEQDALWRLERLAREKAIDRAQALGEGHLLFLNIAPEALHDPILRGPETFLRLSQAGLTPSRVVLEVTEQRALTVGPALREALDQFRRRGFRVALDDVGAGYAGLSTIAEVNPDFIKLDMSLVRELHRHPLKRGLVSTIQDFSARAGIHLVAEGVESEDEFHALQDLGVRLAQGFLFAEPEFAPRTPDLARLRLYVGPGNDHAEPEDSVEEAGKEDGRASMRRTGRA